MRVGSHTRFKGLMLIFLILVGTFYPIYRAQATLPLLAARAVIPAILGRIVVKRAMQTAANDAVYLNLVNNTTRAISATTRANAASVGAKSFFRSSNGALTWAGVGYSFGDISSEYFANKGDVMVATTGKSIGNGRYEVDVGGKTYITDFLPSESNPFIATPVINGNIPSYTVSELTSNMQWYIVIYSTPKQYIVGSIESVAQGYFRYEADKGSLNCPVGKGLCTYEFQAKGIEINQGSTSYVKYQYTAFYTDSLGNEASQIYTPNQAIQVYYNKQYIPDNDSIDKQFILASDVDGFEALEKLKEYQLDLDKLASMLNNLFYQSATQPDYDGIPITSSNPITANEIKSVYPDHGKLTDFDLLYPAQVKPDGDLVIKTPGISTETGQSGKVGLDLGEYPEIDEPDLEEPPTGKEILAPIENLMPFIKNIQLPSKEASCPVAEFNVFDTQYKIDSHCPLLEQNKALFQLIAGVLWGFLSLRIILSA
ncbi:hypothetical protein [Proteus mirabilis]|uniref:hypothetical protein n=1 Tax=Proteus mirabilis TaxID=584 RepID=UPI002576EE19|nr:hypothetical protein [Proteus mirabilis]MDM3617937.1 hypothetical protein [Proteus mirabilis]MDM3667960.1 hypothetical protein [Proteus mirabilis]